MEEKLLIRMPYDREFFFPATAVVHDYVMQLKSQIMNGLRMAGGRIVLEVWDEDCFFLAPMFPRLEMEMGDTDRKLSRSEWSCVLDMRTPDRALKLARTAEKHVTDVWGILFGASPRPLPEIGYMVVYGWTEKTYDILVDEELADAKKMMHFLNINYPEAKTALVNFSSMRIAGMWNRISKAKMYIGKRGMPTYVASMLKLGLVEGYPDDVPRSFLSQPARAEYRVVYGDYSAEAMWPSVEDVWQTLSGSRLPDVLMTELLQSTAVSAEGK